MPPTVDPQALEIPFRTLGAAFADFAARHPDKLAVHSIDQNISLDFAALEKLVDRTAARMAGSGVGRGDRVAILCGECIEKLVLMFAAWRCGASACPFHAEIAPGHLRSILQTIDPAMVVWRRGDLEGDALTDACNAQVFSFTALGEPEGFFATLDNNPGRLPTPGTEYEPEDEGCIFATSGTTDRPKCVVWIISVCGCAVCRLSISPA